MQHASDLRGLQLMPDIYCMDCIENVPVMQMYQALLLLAVLRSCCSIVSYLVEVATKRGKTFILHGSCHSNMQAVVPGALPLLQQLLGSTYPKLHEAAADAIQRLEEPSI